MRFKPYLRFEKLICTYISIIAEWLRGNEDCPYGDGECGRYQDLCLWCYV